MSTKNTVKRILDIVMTILLLFLMGYQFWGDKAHEWAGAGMFLCFILHHILNRNWYRSLTKGKYKVMRIFQTVINVLLFLSMLGLMVSGIILSRHVFAFLPIKGGTSFARKLHMLSAYWGFILMALHIGLHWRMFWNRIKKKISSPVVQNILIFLGTCYSIYGAYAFGKRRLAEYMFMQTQFVFFDFSEPVILFYIDYLSIVALFILLTYVIGTILKKGGKTK